MKLLKPTFEIIEQTPGLPGVYKSAELPGRICYGSQDKITDTSYEEFIERLMKANHGAPLEHGTVYLKWDLKTEDYDHDRLRKYKQNPYTKVNCINEINHHSCYITTNLRVLFDNKWLDDLKYFCEPAEYHEKRITVKFTCDLGVSREFNRHRKDSINEESTRYCNYSKDKYGSEINIIEPCWLYSRENEIVNRKNAVNDLRNFCHSVWIGEDLEEFSDIDYWLFANLSCEYSYMNLINKGWKPQQARTILPLDTKTTLIHTAFISDWEHFFDLRARGTTGAPHPQAKELAEPLMQEFIKLGYIKNEKEVH